MRSYDYAHRSGVEEISWERFAQLSCVLVEKLGAYQIDLVVGIARAGLFPAAAAACAMRCEFFPIRISRRVGDTVQYSHPQWKIPVPGEVKGKQVAVIDEIADTGETLAIVVQKARDLGALKVVSASLVSHPWADPFPEVSALITDALVIFPWDRLVYSPEGWQANPEISAALKAQAAVNRSRPIEDQ